MTKFKVTNSVFQAYSMDCYFRQYWRDERLSFKESEEFFLFYVEFYV